MDLKKGNEQTKLSLMSSKYKFSDQYKLYVNGSNSGFYCESRNQGALVSAGFYYIVQLFKIYFL